MSTEVARRGDYSIQRRPDGTERRVHLATGKVSLWHQPEAKNRSLYGFFSGHIVRISNEEAQAQKAA